MLFLPRRSLGLVLVAVALAALLLSAACGGNENSNTASKSDATPAATMAASGGLPGTEIPSNGNDHITAGQRHGSYYSNPPTSGWHLADLPAPGIYDRALTAEEVPHFLEHGGVWVLYNCPNNGCPELVKQLTDVVNTANEQKKPAALAPYELMDRKIALVAWQRLQTLADFDQGKIEAFIDKLACRYNPEGPGFCPNTAGEKTAARDAGSAGFTGARATATPAGEQVKKYAAAPEMTIDPNKTYIATIVTAKGEIKVQLDAKAAPITVNNFVFLAKDGYYDGLTFHRVIPGFVAQGGDPKGDGTGGPGYSIPDEKSGLKHDEGVIAMAKSSAPNSAGSQFYITLAPQPALDAGYTVFGKVISGMEVVKQISPRDPASARTPGDTITRITIEER